MILTKLRKTFKVCFFSSFAVTFPSELISDGIHRKLQKPDSGGVYTPEGSVPLIGCHVSAKVIDMVAEVSLFQEFQNNSSKILEATYVRTKFSRNFRRISRFKTELLFFTWSVT